MQRANLNSAAQLLQAPTNGTGVVMLSDPNGDFASDHQEMICRALVPVRFPMFRNAAALAYLAHRGDGPRYVLVGGVAWYALADIRQWLETNKKAGTGCNRTRLARSEPPTPAVPVLPKRGRPTKAEQMRRRLAARLPV